MDQGQPFNNLRTSAGRTVHQGADKFRWKGAFLHKFDLVRVCGALLISGVFCILAGGCDATTGSSDKDKADQDHLPQLTEVKLPENFKPASAAAIYVPIYSRIYYENTSRTIELAATLSVRNTDSKNRIILKSVDYYSTNGKLLKKFITGPVAVSPMAAADFVIDREDISGGTGANFVVRWMAETPISEPLAEAVMVSTGSSQSISFVSRGQVISGPSADEDEDEDSPVVDAGNGEKGQPSSGAAEKPSSGK